MNYVLFNIAPSFQEIWPRGIQVKLPHDRGRIRGQVVLETVADVGRYKVVDPRVCQCGFFSADQGGGGRNYCSWIQSSCKVENFIIGIFISITIHFNN